MLDLGVLIVAAKVLGVLYDKASRHIMASLETMALGGDHEVVPVDEATKVVGIAQRVNNAALCPSLQLLAVRNVPVSMILKFLDF